MPNEQSDDSDEVRSIRKRQNEKPHLLLFRDPDRGNYTLRVPGAESGYEFTSTGQAMRFASTLAKEGTAITVFDFSGKVLIKTTVLPT